MRYNLQGRHLHEASGELLHPEYVIDPNLDARQTGIVEDVLSFLEWQIDDTTNRIDQDLMLSGEGSNAVIAIAIRDARRLHDLWEEDSDFSVIKAACEANYEAFVVKRSPPDV